MPYIWDYAEQKDRNHIGMDRQGTVRINEDMHKCVLTSRWFWGAVLFCLLLEIGVLKLAGVI